MPLMRSRKALAPCSAMIAWKMRNLVYQLVLRRHDIEPSLQLAESNNISHKQSTYMYVPDKADQYIYICIGPLYLESIGK